MFYWRMIRCRCRSLLDGALSPLKYHHSDSMCRSAPSHATSTYVFAPEILCDVHRCQVLPIQSHRQRLSEKSIKSKSIKIENYSSLIYRSHEIWYAETIVPHRPILTSDLSRLNLLESELLECLREQNDAVMQKGALQSNVRWIEFY